MQRHCQGFIEIGTGLFIVKPTINETHIEGGVT